MRFLLYWSFSNRVLLTCRSHQIQPKHLSCVSLSCLHMAAKVTEEECNVTSTDELIRIGQCRFSVSDLGRMEKIVAEKLNFKSKAITALTFLHLYHQIALSHSTDRWDHHVEEIIADRKPVNIFSFASATKTTFLLNMTWLQCLLKHSGIVSHLRQSTENNRPKICVSTSSAMIWLAEPLPTTACLLQQLLSEVGQQSVICRLQRLTLVHW